MVNLPQISATGQKPFSLTSVYRIFQWCCKSFSPDTVYCAWSGNGSTTLLDQMCFVHSVLFYVPFCVADNLTYMLTYYIPNSIRIKSKIRFTRGWSLYCIGQKPKGVMKIGMTFFQVSTGDQLSFHAAYMAS